MNLVRDPANGTVWGHTGPYDPATGYLDNAGTEYHLYPAEQDPETRMWRITGGDSTTPRTALVTDVDQWETVTPERRHDPRIERLASLVEQLLDGQPAELTAAVQAAIEDVRQLPEEWARKRYLAYRSAGRRR